MGVASGCAVRAWGAREAQRLAKAAAMLLTVPSPFPFSSPSGIAAAMSEAARRAPGPSRAGPAGSAAGATPGSKAKTKKKRASSPPPSPIALPAPIAGPEGLPVLPGASSVPPGAPLPVGAVPVPRPERAHLNGFIEEGSADFERIVQPHVDSFDFIACGGLDLAVQSLLPVEIPPNAERQQPATRLWIERAALGTPTKKAALAGASTDPRLFPRECREMRLSYGAPLVLTVCRQIGDNGPVLTIQRAMGELPIMVRSAFCHLKGVSRRALVQHGEEANELGGYFIVNGIERIIRLLVVQRRNYVIALVRPSFMSKGPDYSAYACSVRCVRPDQTSQTVVLHYLNDGTCRLRFTFQKSEYFVPAALLLKAFRDATDRQIYESITQGRSDDTFVADRTEIMLRQAKAYGARTQQEAEAVLGRLFRGRVEARTAATDAEVGRELLRQLIFVHLCDSDAATNNRRKFDLLVFMVQKLFALVDGRCCKDSSDALSMQEIMLPGHIYLAVLKEKMQAYLYSIKNAVLRELRTRPERLSLADDTYFRKMLSSLTDIGEKMRYFLATGNLVSSTGLNMQQASGFTVVADKINFLRYLSHFRSVHRGRFFAEMKTTTVRKLLPDAWGFMCPVHTPDGAPCGLLNHLSLSCHVLAHPQDSSRYRPALVAVLCNLGMHALHHEFAVPPAGYLDVLLDGVVVGKAAPSLAQSMTRQLRYLKASGHCLVPAQLEIVYIEGGPDSAYPVIFLDNSTARLVRLVRYLGSPVARVAENGVQAEDRAAPTGGKQKHGKKGNKKKAPLVHAAGLLTEWISPMEQVFSGIACSPEDFVPNETTHLELQPQEILSIVASLTPFSDHNQSPRNMYQCQMGKQTMGTPFHSLPYRVDNKVYRLQCPQTPVVRNETYTRYHMDEYPVGTNAVVAVLSYTGYDMEDAMVINKASAERGFGHGSIYKSHFVDLTANRRSSDASSLRFGIDTSAAASPSLSGDRLDVDGFPFVGTRLQKGDPMYSVCNQVTGHVSAVSCKDDQEAYVEEIRCVPAGGGPAGDHTLRAACFKLRVRRNPVIGDKFSSRHGQKGVLSKLWPCEDMPFTESGIVPDIIINPHAFPSRMTIGMLVESMAGKAGCLHGLFQDGTPFRFNEKHRAVDFFGEQLVKAGYQYGGNEVMYSGTMGVEFKCDIFIGVVYYQRLRHMVSDKSQVRSTGPVNPLTRQPVKGRKVGGGIRFGEMERDSLLAHGAAFLLHDRLVDCSDSHVADICGKCGSVLSPYLQLDTHAAPQDGDADHQYRAARRITCRLCHTHKFCYKLAVPYVFMYLANELAAMNIKLSIQVT